MRSGLNSVAFRISMDRSAPVHSIKDAPPRAVGVDGRAVRFAPASEIRWHDA